MVNHNKKGKVFTLCNIALMRLKLIEFTNMRMAEIVKHRCKATVRWEKARHSMFVTFQCYHFEIPLLLKKSITTKVRIFDGKTVNKMVDMNNAAFTDILFSENLS
uniref:Uncharacterized protein n=1 Tax=Romanomermis culicivorax TaxID=13658 RepID=A0A915JYR2_ROMCU